MKIVISGPLWQWIVVIFGGIVVERFVNAFVTDVHDWIARRRRR